MHDLMQSTFSRKLDWYNILMHLKQIPDEKIENFSVRVRVTARKVGLSGKSLDKMCVNVLKTSSGPYLAALLDNCLPTTSYDEIVEHAMSFERKRDSTRSL